MSTERSTQAVTDSFSALKRFARSSPPAEQCDLCGAVLEPVHPHLLERKNRRIVCGCEPCSILFCDRDDGKYMRIPRRPRLLKEFQFTDLEWEEMTLPINLAFFFRDAEGHVKAAYPSPAGAIESQLPLSSLAEHFASVPELAAMKPEVEALLVNRVSGRSTPCMIAPVDECFRLVGIIRMSWRGLSGGRDVWNAVDEFFDQLQRKAAGIVEERHA
jgi:hypothetical protein